MKTSKCLSLVAVFLFINLETLNAATILGKIAAYSSPSHPDTYPLVSGNKVTCEYRTLIKINGGTLIADRGTVFNVFDEGEQVAFHIDKGSISFRLLPQEVLVSFKTLPGEISSPRVAPASSSVIEGKITVSDKYTILEIAEGSLDVLPSDNYSIKEINGGLLEKTPRGLTKVNAGQRVILAQAEVEETDKNETTDTTKEGAGPSGMGLGTEIAIGGAMIGAFFGPAILLGTTLEEAKEASPIE